MADSTQAFGLTQNLIKAYPELQKVWELFLAGNTTDATNAYYATDYYKNLSNTSKSRQGTKANQPGVYEQDLADYKMTQRKRLVASGVQDVTDAMLEEAYLGGWSENQLDIAALKGTKKALGGAAVANADYLKQYANSLGMSYSSKDYTSWEASIFEGSATLDDFKNKIKTDAMSAYPAYADQINKGVTVDALASAYRNSISKILEVDPDSVGYDNVYLRRAMQYVGADGKPATKPLWEFEKELRSSPEWQYTQNARDSIDSLGLKVLQDWGVA